MEGIFTLVPLVVLVPLGGLMLNLLIGRRLGERSVAAIAVGAAALAFLAAFVLMLGLIAHPEGGIVHVANWINMPEAGVNIPWAFRVDTLSVTMMLVVSGVGTLIHLYAVGYMHGDPRFRRFFIYMNLFLTSMLLLVSGSNYLVLFVGWELVGLCSFLLIGFWLHKGEPDPETGEIAGYKNTNAAKKAFIVNRVGDFGFILALFLLWWTFGTLDYGPIRGAAHGDTEHADEGHAAATVLAAEEAPDFVDANGLCVAHPDEGIFVTVEGFMAAGCDVKLGGARVNIHVMVTLITLLMLLGVAGKSAQIPLFVWLPDAMAGPTPVSALIHAATMVTAGVYMVTRSSVLYEAARGVNVLPLGLTSPGIVTLVGAFTALMAGMIAVAQWDIKRVLAYSTISQLGFMVAAVGLGGYIAGMFHLVTHAFFKALLFLSAGSVIHGVEHGHHHVEAHGEEEERPFGYRSGVLDPQDMRNMGGLKEHMPTTFWVYTIGALALAGIFPLAGFWSKDEILLDAFLRGANYGDWTGWVALVLLVVAAAFTAFYMTRQVILIFFGEPRTKAAAHAHESPPVMTWPLIALAALSVVGGVLNLPGLHSFGHWLQESVAYAHTADFNLLLAFAALALALVAVGLGLLTYYQKPESRARIGDRLDEMMDQVFVALGGKPGTVEHLRQGRDPLEGRLGRVWVYLNGKLYWDEFYHTVIQAPFNETAHMLAQKLDWDFWHDYFHEKIVYAGFNRVATLLGTFDVEIIDRLVNFSGKLAQVGAEVLRRVQTGYVRVYALSVLIGAIAVLLILLLGR